MTEPYTQSLLLYAYQASARQLVRMLRRRGHSKIKPKHGAVFANVDRSGTRPSVLADRAGMGKAAMGEVVNELEALGYVQRQPDPGDGRAKLVVPTSAALEVTALVHAFNRRLEAKYRNSLGAEDYRRLRKALRVIAPEGRMQPRIRTG